MPFKFNKPVKSTPELACVDAFTRAAREIQEWHDNTIPEADVKDFIANMTSMITHTVSPDEYLKYISCGAFKECYHGLGKWIIKFASNHNETGAERQILDAAAEAGISWMFLPTKFIDLPVKLPVIYLEADHEYYQYNCSSPETTCPHKCSACSRRVKNGEEDTWLITAELQPRAITCANAGYERMPDEEEEYDKRPLKLNSGEVIPFDRACYLDVNAISWLRDIIRIYGDEAFERLMAFIDKFGLSDLHEHNTGYITTTAGDMPIFLDWLSHEEGPSETYSR